MPKKLDAYFEISESPSEKPVSRVFVCRMRGCKARWTFPIRRSLRLDDILTLVEHASEHLENHCGPNRNPS